MPFVARQHLGDLLDLVLRSNPHYTFRKIHELTGSERSNLGEFQCGEEYCGILAPDSSLLGLRVQAMDSASAQLYTALQRPQPARFLLRGNTTESADLRLAMLRLVLDGVLQIASGRDFVYGARALDLLFDARETTEPTGHIAKLSKEALRYGEGLDFDDPVLLSWRLYSYNRAPASPKLKTALQNSKNVARLLGVDRGPQRSLLAEKWRMVKSREEYDGWLLWRSTRQPPLPDASPSEGYKLYVSPSYTHLRESFHASLDAATVCHAHSFKVGRDVYGLLRPDKIVIYFYDFNALMNAADKIQKSVDGCPVQGVPFTAEIGGGGLLSWGSDPPPDSQLRPRSGESWRLWVTNRLATALLTGKHSRDGAAIEPWQFACFRAGLDGIDTMTWAPAAVEWLNRQKH